MPNGKQQPDKSGSNGSMTLPLLLERLRFSLM